MLFEGVLSSTPSPGQIAAETERTNHIQPVENHWCLFPYVRMRSRRYAPNSAIRARMESVMPVNTKCSDCRMAINN